MMEEQDQSHHHVYNLIIQKEMDFFVLEFLDQLKIMSVYAVSTKEWSSKVLYAKNAVLK